MTRSFGLVALVAVGAAKFAGTASLAQTAPSERELRIYAGLHDAAARGNAAEIEQLIAEGEKPNIQDANSRTPLHVAAFLRQYEAARALLRLGANANALDAQRYDIITIAAVNNDLEMLRIALEAVVLGNGGRNHTATVEALVEAGADVTLPDRHGITALQHARTRGYSQIARILENAGAH
jgi:ankyrin repeat protein